MNQTSTLRLLNDNYEAPKSVGSYTKLAKGENRVRILSQAITGWLDWKDNKPLRFPDEAKPERPVNADKPLKHFWALVVWNYNEGKIQIWEITQRSIMKSLMSLCADKEWGQPFNYDLKIIRQGEGKETEYTVTPVPHKPLMDYIKIQLDNTPFELEALYRGEDPWLAGQLKGLGSIQEEVEQKDPFSEDEDEFFEMKGLFEACSPKSQVRLREFVLKTYGVKEVWDVPKEHKERTKAEMIKCRAREAA